MALVDVEITISSARDLKNVNWKHGDLCAYAVAWIDDGVNPQPLKITSKVDSHGDTNPSWDQKFTLPVPKDTLEVARLIVEIHHDKADDLSKAIVGRASLALLEAVDAGGYEEVQDYTLKLKRPSGRPHGKIEISLRLREKRAAYGAPPAPYGGQRDWQSAYPGYNPSYPAQPAYAQPYATQPAYNPAGGYPPYGAPPAQPYGAYPPPQPYGSYAPATQPYGSAPPQDNYYNQTPPPYAQDQTAPAKKSGSKFGGIGTGLAVGALAGAVGGLALGEFIDHKEDEAAEEQANEDAERYAQLDAARDDGYGGGDDGGYDEDY